ATTFSACGLCPRARLKAERPAAFLPREAEDHEIANRVKRLAPSRGIKAAGRRGSSEDDLPLPLNRAPDLGDGRGLNPSPDEHRPAANRSMTHSFLALQPGEPDEARKAPLYRGFRRRRAASERQLPQGKRRVAEPQAGDLPELRRQRIEPSAALQAPQGPGRLLGRAAPAPQSLVVRARDPC